MGFLFSSKDIAQLHALKIPQSEAEQQIDNFKKGFHYLKVIAPATPLKGIIQLSAVRLKEEIARFEQFEGAILKFTPASGAASRMFKSLYEAEAALAAGEQIDWNSKAMKSVKAFFDGIKNVAFYEDIKSLLVKQNINIDALSENDYLPLLQTLLNAHGLNYGSLPKGLLKFHRAANGTRTALEEHLVEAALYAKDKRGTARLHFTVSPEHKVLFETLITQVKKAYEDVFSVQYEISFSEQKKNTDTLAVDSDNQPFRNVDGSMLFRPGGHGALIENLNEQKADLVFVKNIDNVAPDAFKQEAVRYKKALAGVLLQLQQQIFFYWQALKTNASDTLFAQIQHFYQNELSFQFPQGWEKDKKTYLQKILHRPIRVCGMVKNEGEPGGGPFIAINPDGSASLQIAESSQLNLNEPAIRKLVEGSTHFNPVDLVCSYRDAEGNYFDLKQYRDPATGFISIKSKDGKVLKAQELPGLWNGAMSNWNTTFVEVPLITFSPVKTVNDLLRKEHQ
jgi:hypothetical protein